MNRNNINFIIGLMAIALLGVISMQFYYLKQSYQLKSQLFDQSVNEALTNVVNKLERQEAYNFLNKSIKIDTAKKPSTQITTYLPNKNKSVSPDKKIIFTSDKSRRQVKYAKLLWQEQQKADSLFNIRDSLLRTRYPYVYSINDGAIEVPQMNLQIDVAEFEDIFGNLHQQMVSRLVPQKAHPRGTEFKTNQNRTDSVKKYLVIDSRGNYEIIERLKPKINTLSQKGLKELEKREPIARKAARKIIDSVQIQEKKEVFQDLATEFQQANIPLSERIHPKSLDSLLRLELLNRGININYDYIVSSAKGNSVIFTKTSNKNGFMPNNTYKTVLFPKDVFRDAGMLMITFPGRKSVLLSNLTAMMLSSGALLLILIVCFGFTLHLILRQKKISEMKTDFINNMTHEFKTPVSTIMIASEALRDPDISGDRSRIHKLAGIIYDENVRLGNHIERVLNIAKIDKGDLKLDMQDMDMNDLISVVADSMLLQLQKKNAKVTLNLHAENPMVYGDELHLSNVIFNLIDNANKYSKENPEIVINTFNVGKTFVVKVTDNGIGMSSDQLSKIFGQFYRIPTGNLHDVKGFGLGLSYVSDIVKRLNGTISVKSEKDKGSEFEITFPHCMKKILLVEDDPNLGMLLQDYLQLKGKFDVVLCKDGEEGLKAFTKEKFDLCIFDVMMPKKDGFTLGRDVRKIKGTVPIIFATAKGMIEDKTEAFNLGGDDYITKPFRIEELLLRITALLKRASSEPKDESEEPTTFSIGKYNFDYTQQIISSEGTQQKVSTKEAELLRLLSLKKNDVLTREEALLSIWHDDNYFNGRSMDVFLSKLRKYLKDDPSVEIINVHGKGYKLLVAN